MSAFVVSPRNSAGSTMQLTSIYKEDCRQQTGHLRCRSDVPHKAPTMRNNCTNIKVLALTTIQ